MEEIPIKAKVDVEIDESQVKSEVEKKVEKPFTNAVSTFKDGFADTNSQAQKSAAVTMSFYKAPETSTYEKLVAHTLAGGAIGAGVGASFVGAGAIPGALVGAITGAATVLIEEMFSTREIRSQINYANLGYSGVELLSPALLDKIATEAHQTIFGATNETIAKLAYDYEKEIGNGKFITAEDYLQNRQLEAFKYFKPERLHQINEVMNDIRGNIEQVNSVQEKGNQIAEKTNQIDQQQIIAKKEYAETQLAVAESETTVASAQEQSIKNIQEQRKEVEQAKDTLGNLEGTMGNVADKTGALNQETVGLANTNSELADSGDQVMKSVEDAGDAMGGAQEQTKQFAEETQQASVVLDGLGVFAADVAAQLNESLLNTSVDIESEIKGDRLLEFDETKKIAEKFQQFIEGDLQARFIFSIREFFVGAFESLGVLGDSAQSFVDQQFEEFQNLSDCEENVVSLKEFRKENRKDTEYSEEEYRMAA